MISLKKFFGPSTLVAAAFIGPGTLTTCTIVGVQTSYALLWAMLFAIIATIVLQEMSARLGFITQSGLGEAFNSQFRKGPLRILVFVLVIGAILIGNAAYEAGNISGGILGLDLLIGELKVWPLVIGGLCFGLLYFGKYKWIEGLLIAMVLLMSVCFLITAILVKPDFTALLSGFWPGNLPKTDFFLVAAVVGTTVVPYNLFLHASTISKKWRPGDSIGALRIENGVSVALGGLISILIIITAASSSDTVQSITGAKDLAIQLEPLFGKGAKWFMGVGLMAAGISSALTAPLAAAFAAKGLFGWKDEQQWPFKMIWMSILICGVLVAITDLPRVAVIQFAQITNALLLPFTAIYLLHTCNSKALLGKHINGWVSNVLGVIVVLVTLMLSIKSLNSIFDFL